MRKRLGFGRRAGQRWLWVYCGLMAHCDQKFGDLSTRRAGIPAIVRSAAEVPSQDQRQEIFTSGLGAARAGQLDRVHRHVDVGVGLRGLVVPTLAGLPFGHGAEHMLDGDLVLIDSYHCSRQNTNTGRLTRRMFAEVFARAQELRR